MKGLLRAIDVEYTNFQPFVGGTYQCTTRASKVLSLLLAGKDPSVPEYEEWVRNL